MKRDKKNRLLLRIGQKVIFPKLHGVLEKERPAKVVAEYPTYYLAKTRNGYLESIPAYGDCGVKL